MNTLASAKGDVLVGESISSFQSMLQNVQVGDTVQHNGDELSVVTKTFKLKDFGFLIEISIGEVTLVSEQTVNFEEMLWMIQAGNILVQDGGPRIVREKLFLKSGAGYSPSIYLMMP
ncbi:hypothetical protein C1886_02650 [Pseudomonas sp. FW300-N1A1]|uniref:hypothetical protein n=1 Tax=Pseudomonas sp. FW300-N1A1 TaxID=2075555 RepID=UPI000CD2E2A6|nr:hypothetical protein [Pseudomonas sp. FW300-N1A1]POA22081.1 hypothetical protein C1886_02650 [Pseudomonas sp. FW300-N1A1]